MKKKLLKSLVIIAASVMVLSLLTRLVMPKYSEHLIEGGMLPQYYQESGNHEVIFIGDCEVYANINPLIIYENTGITSYIRGSSQQLLWQSYYVLEETLSYEIPKVVILNVNAMRYDEPVKEEYNRLCIDGMKWSKSKISIIKASMSEEENFLSYVFPILRYHSRIFSLDEEDFTYLFKRKNNTFNGHIINTDVQPVGSLPAKRKLPDYQFGDICYQYLDKIRTLCEENGIELVLMKAPSLYPYWYDEYEKQIKEYAAENGLKYYNFTEQTDEIGLDFSTDTYDAGIHLNEAGAVKFSGYLADILKTDFNLKDFRYNKDIDDIYQKMMNEYRSILEN